MSQKLIIGIDVGGTTTKIVGFTQSKGCLKLIEPLYVKANDPLTSVYGAFGKFLDINGISISNIDKIMMTGAGSSYLSKPIYDLPCYKIEEFKAIGLGGLYVSGLDSAIIASCGTGTALVYATQGAEPKYLGGTGVGGGTLSGLAKKLVQIDSVSHLSDLAIGGNLDNVDLKINDITKADILPGFGDIMTASNFGSISDMATREDIALGLFNMVFETIGMVAIFAARNYNIRDIVLTGNLSKVPQAPQIFGKLNKMFNMNFIIPENSPFGTVIGAALAGM